MKPRCAPGWNTKFGQFVAQHGVQHLCADLAARGHPITPHAVYGWIYGRCCPRPSHACDIVDASGNALTFADLYRSVL